MSLPVLVLCAVLLLPPVACGVVAGPEAEPASPGPAPDAEALAEETAQSARQRSDQRGDVEEEVLTDLIDVKRTRAEQASPPEPKPPPAVGPPEPPPERKKILPMVFYADLRLNLVDTRDGFELTDGASRIGALLDRKFNDRHKLFGRAEFGVNVVEEFSYLITPDASAQDGNSHTILNPRLYYLGYDVDGFRALAGKNWSVYYDVAGRTDAFAVYGGLGAGVYNANTDGGGSGTGRADQVIQFRNRHPHWRVGLQFQHDTSIPVFEGEAFKYGFGASLRHRLESGVGVGLALNLAEAGSITPAMRQQGFRGRDQALALSLNYQVGHWNLATVLADLRNHEADDQQQFFHGWGWETYLRYDLSKRLRGIGGWNVLRPKGDDGYQGAYRIEDYIVGFQYAFGEMTFQDMVYIEYKLDRGRLSSGEDLDNGLAIGLRRRWVW